MFQKILVPLDGSAFGEHALPMALSIARRAEARIELVHVYAPLHEVLGLEENSDADAAAKQKARDYLDRLVERLKAVAPVQVEATLLEGPIADRLLERAGETNADLIVLTTHGRGPLSRSWLGSVADELVRRAVLPLLLVRPQEQTLDLAAEPTLRRMLIPLDGSAFAEQILKPATALGSLMQTEYRLLRVIQLVVTSEPDVWFVPSYPMLDVELESHARAYLQPISERLRQEQACMVQTQVMHALNPASAILDDAHAHDVDLIALATHGRGGLTRLFLGSVADKVVRGASVPVLVYRPSAES